MTGTIRATVGASILAIGLGLGGSAWAASDEHAHIPRQKWTFGGLFGKFDDGQLQRGFKVYSEVCSRCHSVKRLYFRNLVQPGGQHRFWKGILHETLTPTHAGHHLRRKRRARGRL